MSEVDVDDYAVERAIPDFGRCYCFTPGAMSAFVAEVERAAAAKALAKVRSEIRQIPRWWNSELGYGEFDLQPLGPYETSEKGAYMEVMRVLDECAAEIREGGAVT